MSTPTTDQGHVATTKEAEQSTTQTISDTSKTENSTDSGASNEPLQQTGPGPKVLRSHYRGMPRQWEKNQHPKKDGEGE